MYQYNAKILRVVDGDTVDVQIDLGFHISIEMKLRLAGINAPELSEDAGKKSRDVLKEKLYGKNVIVYTLKDRQEKYGRYLARIICDGIWINDWLLEEGFAEVYK